MTIAEKIVRAKADLDSVYEAGVEKGRSEATDGVIVEPLEVVSNGTYTAPNGIAYSPVKVNVPDVNGSYDQGYEDGYEDGKAEVAPEDLNDVLAAQEEKLAELSAILDKKAEGVVIDKSTIIEKTVSGEKFVYVDDVSEIPHKVNVQVSSDKITDFSNVPIYVSNNQFLDISANKNSGNAQGVIEGDTITVHQKDTITYQSYNIPIADSHLLKGKTITISADVDMSEGATNEGAIRCLYMNGAIVDATYGDIYIATKQSGHIVVSGLILDNAPDDYVLCLLLYSNFSGTGVANAPIKYSNIKVKIGETESEYKPYNKQMIIPSASGEIKDVDSISTEMIVFADDNVNISMSYHKSYGMQVEYDKFWDLYQKKGKRTEYWGAFGTGFTNENFKPKYPLIVTGCSYMFYYSSIINVDVDLDFSNASSLANLMPSSSIQTLKKIILKSDGSQAFNGSFDCNHLVDIYEIVGVIGQNLKLSQPTKLSKETILRFFNALKDYSGSGTTHTVTLGATNLAKLSDAEKLIATQKGWTLA